MTRNYRENLVTNKRVGYLDSMKTTISLDELTEREEQLSENEESSPCQVWLNAFKYKPVFRK